MIFSDLHDYKVQKEFVYRSSISFLYFRLGDTYALRSTLSRNAQVAQSWHKKAIALYRFVQELIMSQSSLSNNWALALQNHALTLIVRSPSEGLQMLREAKLKYIESIANADDRGIVLYNTADCFSRIAYYTPDASEFEDAYHTCLFIYKEYVFKLIFNLYTHKHVSYNFPLLIE